MTVTLTPSEWVLALTETHREDPEWLLLRLGFAAGRIRRDSAALVALGVTLDPPLLDALNEVVHVLEESAADIGELQHAWLLRSGT